MFYRMNMELAAREAALEYLESGVEIQNVDYRSAAIYIAHSIPRGKVVQCGLANWFQKGGLSMEKHQASHPRKQ